MAAGVGRSTRSLELMNTQPANAQTPRRIGAYICAGFGVFASLVALIAWAQSGQTAHLLGAMAFAALVPSWYLRPVSFTQPMSQQLKGPHEPMPKSVVWLTVAGFVLLGASIAVRLAA